MRTIDIEFIGGPLIADFDRVAAAAVVDERIRRSSAISAATRLGAAAQTAGAEKRMANLAIPTDRPSCVWLDARTASPRVRTGRPFNR